MSRLSSRPTAETGTTVHEKRLAMRTNSGRFGQNRLLVLGGGGSDRGGGGSRRERTGEQDPERGQQGGEIKDKHNNAPAESSAQRATHT
jgi:hypothetical protein